MAKLIATIKQARVDHEYWIYEIDPDNLSSAEFPGELPNWYLRVFNGTANRNDYAVRHIKDKPYSVWRVTRPHNRKLEVRAKLHSWYKSEREAVAGTTGVVAKAERKANVKEVTFAVEEPSAVEAEVVPFDRQLLNLIADVRSARTAKQRRDTYERLSMYMPQLSLLVELYDGLTKEMYESLQ